MTQHHFRKTIGAGATLAVVVLGGILIVPGVDKRLIRIRVRMGSHHAIPSSTSAR